MTPATAIAIKAGIDFLVTLWGQLENKPEGWKPTPEDWSKLDAEVADATPEARYLLAVARAKLFQPTGHPTATP